MAPFSFILTVLLYALTCSARALGQAHALLPRAGSLEQVTDFGDNPTNVGMYIYVPNNLASSPGIVVAIHYCKAALFNLWIIRKSNWNLKAREPQRPTIPALPMPSWRNSMASS